MNNFDLAVIERLELATEILGCMALVLLGVMVLAYVSVRVTQVTERRRIERTMKGVLRGL